MTINQCFDRYECEAMPEKRPETRKRQRTQVAYWRARFGDMDIMDLKAADIREAKQDLLDTLTQHGKPRNPKTVCRYLALLQAMINFAIMEEWEPGLEVNPCRKVRRPKCAGGRIRVLSDDERRRLLYECRYCRNPDIYPIVLIALTTGARLNEILGATWAHYDTERGLLTIPDTKNGRPTIKPIVPEVRELLAHKPRVGERIFPQRTVRTAFQACVRRAGIQNLKFHDLRHAAASYLAQMGCSLFEIGVMLNHKSPQSTAIYAHLCTEQIEVMSGKLAAKIFSDNGKGTDHAMLTV